jgi:lysozyme family protein
MLLNTFYLSVQGRLFRMETFCLFSRFKGVISIYIWMGFVVFKLCSFQHGNCNKEAELVGEGNVDAGQR